MCTIFVIQPILFFVFTRKVVIAGDKLFPSINTRNVDLDEFRALKFVLLYDTADEILSISLAIRYDYQSLKCLWRKWCF